MNHKMEILAPAADMVGVIAAINGGADGVYFGLKHFNARQRAGNFEEEDLEKVIDLCHDHGLKAYITLNILIKDKELQEAMDMACTCYAAGCDGLIVQDPGLIWLLRQYLPDLPLQTSTQCSVFGVSGVGFFEELGFVRVVLPREMSLDEARTIRARTQVELKVFGHGALCYAYSGQCLFSSLIGGRSGNRGLCAQPCRKRYTLTNAQGVALKSGYLMSMRDLNTREGVRDMMDAGVSVLKIEGRMKGAPYIYAASKAYQQAAQGEDGEISHDALTQVFNRSFTSGWLLGDPEKINPISGRNKGVYIGKVIDVQGKAIVLKLNEDVHISQGDGLSFGEDAFWGFTVEKFRWDHGKTTVFYPSFSTQKRPSFKIGTKVYRTMNGALMAELETKASAPLKVSKEKVSLSLRLRCGEQVKAQIKGKEIKEEISLPVIPEAAQSHPLTEEMIREQMQKTGDTKYDFSPVTIDLGEDLFLSKSSLNAIRREMIAVLTEREKKEKQAVPSIDLKTIFPILHREPVKQPKIQLILPENPVNGLTLEDYLSLDADEMVLPTDWDLERLNDQLQLIRHYGKKAVVILPRVMTTTDDDRLMAIMDDFIRLPMDGCVVPHYEGLSLLREKGISLEAGRGLHLFNSATAEALKVWGCDSGVLSPELTAVQAEAIAENSSLDCTLTVYGRQEMMVSRNCLMNCAEKHCETCQDHHQYYLVDERNAAFPFYRDPQGYTRIFNSAKLFIRNPWRCPHVAKWQIQVLDESLEELRDVIAYYRSGGKITDVFDHTFDGVYTSGSFKREVI